MSDWKEVQLKDVSFYSDDRISVDQITVYNYLSTENMLPDRGGVTLASSLPSSKTVSKYNCEDILISNIRPYFKKIWFADKVGGCSNDVLVIKNKDTNQVDSKFLYYNLFTDKFFDYVMSGAKGAKMPRGDKDEIMKYSLIIPPLKTQQKIVKILSNIDNKIQVNLKMNKILEEMGMTLYKHWFVDFEPFQDEEFSESELGLIPKDWSVSSVGNAIEIIGGGTPKTSISEYWENGIINWFSPTDLTSQKSMFITNSAKKITQLGLEKSSAKLFPPYSIMMTSRATIGEISINREPSSTNQGFITLIPNENFNLYQLYFWLKTNMEKIMSISNGSTFKEVSKTNFKMLQILKAVRIEEYTKKCENIFKQIECNLCEIEGLTRLRGYLLPRLLSGEIDLLEIEKQVEEV
ncbi:restriction endonuclease subunit S [Bacillus xiapuensis]|uniref:restriction endonuclease subunit S n=1 Tax=Bacillus xiapuensis TaxID=2014075 RepID=UPI000C246A2F|nr:restriction endonuclease subunit S [Bacillus xiapuensis]